MFPKNKKKLKLKLHIHNKDCRASQIGRIQGESKCILINGLRKHNILHELYLTPDKKLEVAEEMKLVGHFFRDYLKNTSNINQ